MRADQGFTLLETLLSVAIITILTGVSIPLYRAFANQNDIAITTQSVAAALRRAQTYARANTGNSQWGVAIQAGEAVLFKGANYGSRDAAFDEEISLNGVASSSGLAEIVFAKTTATPSTTGSITLTSQHNDTRTISINVKGMVDY